MDIEIDRYMTRDVHTVNARSALAEAHRVMNEFGIRHLPVLDGGKLVGMVTQRDLHLVETLRDVDPKVVTVEEAMTQDVLAVQSGTPLIRAVEDMHLRKAGSMLVLEGRELLGIFTTTDALRALEELLDQAGREGDVAAVTDR